MKSCGELAEAEATYRRAIELEPRSPAALARLGTLLRGQLPEQTSPCSSRKWPTRR